MENVRRRRYSLAEREAIVSAFKKRTGSVKSFVLETKVCYPTLRKWITDDLSTNIGKGFIALRPPSVCPTEIQLPNGILIRSELPLTADFIHQLMRE